MDNLVLTRLAGELSVDLADSILEEFRQESAERFRLVFATGSGPLALIVSLRSELPWTGRPAFRWIGPAWSPDPFAVAAAKALAGRKVAGVTKQAWDRAFRIEVGDGRGLVVELATHAANMVLLGAGGVVETAARQPKRGGERLERGRLWAPRGVPAGMRDPFALSADEIDALLAEHARDGLPPPEALRRGLTGIGPAGAALVSGEAAARGVSLGIVLRERLDAVLQSATEIVIEGPSDPKQAAERGDFDPQRFRLHPWRPGVATPGIELFAERSPSATIGLFHESVERVERVRARVAALGTILRGELRRTIEAESKVRGGLRSFVDPQRFARMGEALLAGLSAARRSGGSVYVPDPYDPEVGEIEIPAPPGRPLAQVADELFQRGRRARRGAATAAARAEALAVRAARLEGLLEAQGRTVGLEGAAALEDAMRAEKIAVGFTGPSRAAKAAALTAAPRLEGVRILVSAEGWTILVGRTGRDNDRLTFKIAAPEDVWLHAAGVSGAHVVIRNPERVRTVPPATLAEAARAAAWYSDAKGDAAVDVQWTRRKNVRRARGGVSGRVILKRFETVRVRPEPPPGQESA